MTTNIESKKIKQKNLKSEKQIELWKIKQSSVHSMKICKVKVNKHLNTLKVVFSELLYH